MMRSDRHPLKVLFRLVRPYRGVLPVLVTLGILASLAEGLGIGLLIPALDALLNTDPDRQMGGAFTELMRRIPGRMGEAPILPVVAVFITVLILAKTALLVLEAIVSTRINGRLTRDLRQGLMDQYLSVGMAWHGKNESGRLVNTLDSHTYMAAESVKALAVMIGAVSTVAVFTILLFLISWQLAIVAVGSALPIAFLARLLARHARRNGDQLVNAYADLVSRVIEVLGAMRTIRLFGQEERERRRFAEITEIVRLWFVRTESLIRVLPTLVELLYLPVFFLVIYQALALELPVPALLAFLLLLFRIQNPLKRIDHSRATISSYASALAEIEAVLDPRDKPFPTSGSRPSRALAEGIRFEKVGFRYSAEAERALDDVSFEIPARTTLAIAGASGSGKSTLVNLLCRFHDPTEGRITVDGHPLEELELRSWRNRVALAGQDAELMTGSVAFNIAYGEGDADFSRIQAAAEVAQAHEFIMKLPQGYETVVGARGLSLSGGQRQRIALARALLTEPDILILDEATNSVDAATETAILRDTVARLAGTMTILIIAHRASVLEVADHVVVLDHGQVVQVGTPSSLKAHDGEWSRLFAEAPMPSGSGS